MSDCFTRKRDELRLGFHFLYFFTAPFDTLAKASTQGAAR